MLNHKFHNVTVLLKNPVGLSSKLSTDLEGSEVHPDIAFGIVVHVCSRSHWIHFFEIVSVIWEGLNGEREDQISDFCWTSEECFGLLVFAALALVV